MTRLHRCILTECSDFLRTWGLDELLSLEPVELSAEELDDFGDRDTVTYRLEQERTIQFITWKQNVLDLMLRFISQADSPTVPDETICLGVSSFYHVWEEACKTSFGDMLSNRLDALGIVLESNWRPLCRNKLIDIIPRPKWIRIRGNQALPCGDVSTLIPDVVTIHDDGLGHKAFCIYDAKYYTPQLGDKTRGVPGVESITKQYLYQAAYKQFVSDHAFSTVINVFLVPTSGISPRHLGRVEFPGIFERLESPFSNGIDMWGLPAGKVFNCYLRGSLIDAVLIEKIVAASSQAESFGA